MRSAARLLSALKPLWVTSLRSRGSMSTPASTPATRMMLPRFSSSTAPALSALHGNLLGQASVVMSPRKPATSVASSVRYAFSSPSPFPTDEESPPMEPSKLGVVASRKPATSVSSGVAPSFSSPSPFPSEENENLLSEAPLSLLDRMLQFLALDPFVCQQADGHSYPVSSLHDKQYRTIRSPLRTPKELENVKRKNTYSREELEAFRRHAKGLPEAELPKLFGFDLAHAEKYVMWETAYVEPRKNLQHLKVLERLGLHKPANILALLRLPYKEQLLSLLEVYCQHHPDPHDRQAFFTKIATNQAENFPWALDSLPTVFKFSLKYGVAAETICLSRLIKNLEDLDRRAKTLAKLDAILGHVFEGAALPRRDAVKAEKIITALLQNDEFMQDFQDSLSVIIPIDKRAWTNVKAIPEVNELFACLSCSHCTLRPAPASAGAPAAEPKSGPEKPYVFTMTAGC